MFNGLSSKFPVYFKEYMYVCNVYMYVFMCVCMYVCINIYVFMYVCMALFVLTVFSSILEMFAGSLSYSFMAYSANFGVQNT